MKIGTISSKQWLKGKTDDFWVKENCERCGTRLDATGANIRTMSWFSNETICTCCIDKEREVKRILRNRGHDVDALEGCGYVPSIKSKRLRKG